MAEKRETDQSTQDQLMALIQALPAAIAAAGGGLTAQQMKELLDGVATSTQKAMRPENAVHPHISVYSYPEGDIAREKPKLKRDTFFCGHKENEDQLTPGEIEAYNAFNEPREARGGSWRAEIKRSRSVGGREALFIWVPAASVDHRMMLPSGLTLILNELNGGPSTENIAVLLNQIERLKSMLLQTKTVTAQDLEAALLAS